MRCITANHLWIGNAIDARTPVRLHEIGIVAVVDLAVDEPIAQLSREMVYCRFPLLDGAGNDPAVLRAAAETTASLIRDKVPTLVSCSAGMSRSPAIVAAATALVRQTDPDECLLELIDAAPRDVSPPLWAELKAALADMLA